MDDSKSRKSDAAATRKRRSSILKSQRAPRAPFSDLEFNVATPQDTAKSRRVSFSRRTGVAEFEINDATTAWKNVYEEHNKSLETSGNESGGARPRRVQHLGGRSADLFQDAEAELVGDELEVAAPHASLELSQLTEQRTAGVFRLALDVSRGATDRLDLDFSSVAPLADHDDLDVLQRDLDSDRRADMSEYNIDVDFNATHFTLKGDDSDDMSITDSVRGPRVAAADERLPDWTADKENIVVNPYVAPPPADFADDECDDILVFDGKKCKFQSNLSDDDLVKPASLKKTIVNDTAGDICVTRAVAERVLLPTDEPPGLGVVSERARASNTVFFDDVADMTVTQALPAHILPQKPDLGLVSGDVECILAGKETRRQTIVYGNEDADISVTQALPANIIAPIQIACDDSNIVPQRPESKTEKQKTMYFDDMADISVTQTVPANIIQQGNNERDVAVKQTAPFSDEVAQPRTDRRRTIVYGNDDGDLSVTGALPVNILDKEAKPNQANAGCRTTIVYENDNSDVSITGVVPANIMDRNGAKLAQPEYARRTTIVYDNDDGNISMTGVVPANIVVDRNEAKLAESSNTDRRKTIVYGKDDGNISMTGVVPANIVVNRSEAKLAASSNTDRRRTIVYGNDDGNISMTGVVPANIVVNRNEAKLAESSNTDRRKTIVYGNDDGNISMTGVVPANIVVNRSEAKLAASSNTDRRRTIVYGNDDGNISMTGVVPANIVVNRNEAKLAESSNTDRRKTIVYGNDDGNISMTGVVPANIVVNRSEAKLAASSNTDRRRTIVYGNDDGNISMTGVVPANIVVNRNEAKLAESSNTDRRKTIVYGNDDGNISMTGVVPANIVVNRIEAKLAGSSNTDRRKTIVYGNDDGNISMTGVVPANIVVNRSEAKLAGSSNTDRPKTIVYGNDDGNISMTGVVPANIVVNKDEDKPVLSVNSELRKSVLYGNNVGNVSQPATDRRTIVYGNDDGHISMTGVVPANIMVEREAILPPTSNTDRRKTIVYGNDDGNISMTGVVPANIIVEGNDAKLALPTTTDRRKTVVFENNDGNISVTGVIPTNIILDEEIANLAIHTTTERRKTVVFENNDGNISITGVAPTNIMVDEEIANPVIRTTTERRKTVVFGNDDGNVSMTGAVPANIIVNNETKLPDSSSNERRKTIVYGNDDGEISMTGVVPDNIMMDKNESKQIQSTNIELRRTAICGNDDGDVSTTGAAPARLVVAEKLEDGAELIKTANAERRGTVVYGNENGDVSMTIVVPAHIIVVDRVNQIQRTNAERRKTVALEGNVSMPGVVKAEHCIAEEQGDKADRTQPAIERRKTIDYGNDDGNLSMTAVVPANVTMDKSGVNETQPVHIERRKTIVYENEDADISMTGVVPADVIEESHIVGDNAPKKTGVHENDNGNNSMTRVVQALIGTAKENEEAVEIITGTTDYRAEDGGRGLHTQTQPIETEIISEDKNDQVSMSAGPRSPSVMSHGDISVQTSAVSRRSLAYLTYGDLSHSKTMSTFHKSPDKVVVYEASTRGAELGPAQREPDSGSVSTYASQEGGARNVSPGRSEREALSLTSTRVSTTDVQSRKSDNFEAMCAATLDAFSRSLAADRPSTTDARPQSSMPDSTSMLDPLSRTGPNRASVFDELSRSSGPDRMVLSRSLAPDRASMLEALSPRAALERAALSRTSPPGSVLDALLDMSSIDDELVSGPSEGPPRAGSAATVPPAGERSCYIVKDSDDEADNEAIDGDDADDEEMRTSGSTTPPEYEENRGVGDSARRFGEHVDRAVGREGSPKKEDTGDETSVERDEGNQTHWLSRCAGTQADDTRALLDALDRFADSRRSGDRFADSRRSGDRFADSLRSGDLAPPRRSLAPDRRSMVRSREELLKDISMAQALIRTEMEQSDSTEDEEAAASPPPRFSGEVVKTLLFDDDSVRESPRVLRKPVPVEPESRRAAVIPPYLQSVGEIKDLMEELVKPTADAAPGRHSGAQTDSLPSSQIDLVSASYRAASPAGAAGTAAAAGTPAAAAAAATGAARPPLARLGAASAPLVFDRHNPLNNVALPVPPPAPVDTATKQSRASTRDGSVSPDVSDAAVETRVSPDVSHAAVETRVSPDVSHAAVETRGSPDVSDAAVDTRVSPAVFAAHSVSRQRANRAGTPMEEDIPVEKHRSPQRVAFRLDDSDAEDEHEQAEHEHEQAEHEQAEHEQAEHGEARKRGYCPADPRDHDLTPKPAVKMQKISRASSPRRRSESPRARSRAASDVTVQQLLSEVHLSEWPASARGASPPAARSADDVCAAAGADLINSIAALPFMGTECSWESVSGDTWSFRLLRGRLRLVVRLQHGVQRARADAPVVLACVQHAVLERDEGDPVALWCARLAAEALQQLALNTRRAGALPATLRHSVALCRTALRWARAMHHARLELAFSLDDTGQLLLKVANIPLRSVWEVSLRIEVAEGAEGAEGAAGAGGAWPRAADVRVARVVASWAPAQRDLDELLQPLPRDWGHVPRAVWKIFKYLKHKRLDDDDLLGA